MHMENVIPCSFHLLHMKILNELEKKRKLKGRRKILIIFFLCIIFLGILEVSNSLEMQQKRK